MSYVHQTKELVDLSQKQRQVPKLEGFWTPVHSTTRFVAHSCFPDSKGLPWKGFIKTLKTKTKRKQPAYLCPWRDDLTSIRCNLYSMNTSPYRIKMSQFCVLCILVKSSLSAQLSLRTRWVSDAFSKAGPLLQSSNKAGVVRFRCWCLSFLSSFFWGHW